MYILYNINIYFTEKILLRSYFSGLSFDIVFRQFCNAINNDIFVDIKLCGDCFDWWIKLDIFYLNIYIIYIIYIVNIINIYILYYVCIMYILFMYVMIYVIIYVILFDKYIYNIN